MPADSIVCLTCRERAAATRGCCNRCYERHRSAVRAGKTTWAALEAEGLALPAVPRGRAWRRYPMRDDS
jgi:hypothetical protein